MYDLWNVLGTKLQKKNKNCMIERTDSELCDAALLIRGYTQHALHPYTDSEIKYIRHFITIQFVNKGIELINVPIIF